MRWGEGGCSRLPTTDYVPGGGVDGTSAGPRDGGDGGGGEDALAEEVVGQHFEGESHVAVEVAHRVGAHLRDRPKRGRGN